MNLSTVVTRIKLKLGLLNIATPFEDLDETIVTILQKITIPVFSMYCPYKDRLHVKTIDLELVEKTTEYEKYLLPEWKTRKLLYVMDINYDSGTLAGLGSYGVMPAFERDITTQLLISQAGMNLLNTMVPKITFKFEPPRTLYIYKAYSYTDIIIDLAFEHDQSLASIPDSQAESFMKLALLDVKENLYPTVQQYTEMNTAVGNINFKIDNWADAENQRQDLLNQWDDNYHLDFKGLWFG